MHHMNSTHQPTAPQYEGVILNEVRPGESSVDAMQRGEREWPRHIVITWG
jgi:hypothetical protein